MKFVHSCEQIYAIIIHLSFQDESLSKRFSDGLSKKQCFEITNLEGSVISLNKNLITQEGDP